MCLSCIEIQVCELENNPQFVLDVNHQTDLKIALIQVKVPSLRGDLVEIMSLCIRLFARTAVSRNIRAMSYNARKYLCISTMYIYDAQNALHSFSRLGCHKEGNEWPILLFLSFPIGFGCIIHESLAVDLACKSNICHS